MISCQHHSSNSKGFTLIEILAALVILSIVLVSFFAFFSQSALFTHKHKENLEAINIAQDTIIAIQKNPSYFQQSKTYTTNFPDPEKTILNVNAAGIYNHYPSYKLQLSVTKDSEYNLYKINVIINDLDGNQLTETYHFLKGPS